MGPKASITSTLAGISEAGYKLPVSDLAAGCLGFSGLCCSRQLLSPRGRQTQGESAQQDDRQSMTRTQSHQQGTVTPPITAHPACSETKQQQQDRALNLNKSKGAPAVMPPLESTESFLQAFSTAHTRSSSGGGGSFNVCAPKELQAGKVWARRFKGRNTKLEVTDGCVQIHSNTTVLLVSLLALIRMDKRPVMVYEITHPSTFSGV